MLEQPLVAVPWQIADTDWQRIQLLLPVQRPKPKGGRPRMPDRQALEAILFVAYSGCRWKQLPRELGASSTVHDRFQQWRAARVFAHLVQAGLLDQATLKRLKIADPGSTPDRRGKPPSGRG